MRKIFVDTAIQVAEARKKEYEQALKLYSHGNRYGI